MENYSIVIFILAVMIGLSALTDRIKLPYPVLLVTGGILIGFIPSLPRVDLEPDIVFLIFLPPLLYDAAFNISFPEFRANRNTIGTLAISLVFLTASGIALAARYLIPGMTWEAAFVLGGILSATDAVAAISVTKGLGLSKKAVTILEGESLINDASALVVYRFALAAVTGVVFVVWKAAVSFLVLMAGGALVGIAAGKLSFFILNRVQANTMVTISLMLLMPFVTYLVAENIHVSGVIAVVILGLSMTRLQRKTFPDGLKQQSQNIWEILIFLLNGLIFILIGLQFPYVIKTIDHGQIMAYVGYAFIITVVALLLRMARVFLQQINLQRAFNRHHKRIREEALFDTKTSLLISWSGMRGIVSLAMAIALPLTGTNGAAFPQRSAIIFISVVVVLFTIVGQGLTLPWLVRKLKGKA